MTALWSLYVKKVATRATLVRSNAELAAIAAEVPGVFGSEDHAAIETREGMVHTRFPFWLALDAGGRPYPIEVGQFQAMYRLAPETAGVVAGVREPEAQPPAGTGHVAAGGRT